jgi:hypothetical protein
MEKTRYSGTITAFVYALFYDSSDQLSLSFAPSYHIRFTT